MRAVNKFVAIAIGANDTAGVEPITLPNDTVIPDYHLREQIRLIPHFGIFTDADVCFEHCSTNDCAFADTAKRTNGCGRRDDGIAINESSRMHAGRR